MDNEKKISCHFISNTHWDREWRFSARRTQYMLGYMLDMLIDIIEKNPEYKHFHLQLPITISPATGSSVSLTDTSAAGSEIV